MPKTPTCCGVEDKLYLLSFLVTDDLLHLMPKGIYQMNNLAEWRVRIAAVKDAMQRELQDYTIRAHKTYEMIPVATKEVKEDVLA